MSYSAAFEAVERGEHPAAEDGGPCATCAFRRGTEANASQHTRDLAQLSVEGSRLFYCHEQPQLCRGYVAAMNLRGVTDENDADAVRWCEAAGLAADILAVCIGRATKADDAMTTQQTETVGEGNL